MGRGVTVLRPYQQPNPSNHNNAQNGQTMMTIPFSTVGRLPVPGDNAAIAIRILEPGTTIQYGDKTFQISHKILEGHRFAVEPIAKGSNILSWALPFGKALKDIQPGEYLANANVITEL